MFLAHLWGQSALKGPGKGEMYKEGGFSRNAVEKKEELEYGLVN